MDTNIDPKVKALTQAIRRAETGGLADPYNARGASGEFGAYQFMPDTFKNYAQKYLGDANAQPTVENQNKIAYSFVKEKKDAGHTPAQIASMWNAGEGRPNAYAENFRGVNKLGVAYDVPAYVAKVSKNYKELSAQLVPTAQASTGVQPKEPAIGASPAGLGKALGVSIGANARSEKVNEDIQKIIAGQRDLLSRRNQRANAGQDTTQLDKALAQTNRILEQLGGSAQDVATAGIRTKDVVGAALGTAAYLPVGFGASKVASAIGGGSTLRNIASGVASGAISGAGAGALQGAGDAMTRDESVVGGAIKGGLIGGALGGVVGGAVPATVGAYKAVRGTVRDTLNPTGIMNRVARINPSDSLKFKRLSGGKESGEYLAERGIFGDKMSVAEQLVERAKTSMGEVDNALAGIKKTYKNNNVKQALDEVRRRAIETSPKNQMTDELRRLVELTNKYKRTGLNMSEINEVKRIYERTVRLDYVKSNAAKEVARATNLDSAIRTWQIETARKAGVKNLAELNKETQLAKELANSLGKTIAREQGNNAISLTDWILLANGDPMALASFGFKKTFSSPELQARLARYLAKKPTVGLPKAEIGAEEKDLLDFLQKYDLVQ